MRRAARRDANEPAIVEALKRCGATVILMDDTGCPDLLVGFRGATFLVEVKTEAGRLEQSQVDWMARWRGGQVHVVRSELEALRAIGAVV